MAELTINQVIKIIIGIFVVVVVIVGLYFAFREKILAFFKNLPTGAEPITLIGSLFL
jgi:hypothetical protein